MELLAQFLDIVLHLDKHLTALIQTYGVWVYAILFLIIFCETGLVVTPFLPGDSLLFVVGTLAASGALDVHGVFARLVLAAFSGDNTNYWIGRYVGPRVFKRERSRFLNPAHLERTQRFYDKHGGKTVVMARFLPIFAPSCLSLRESDAWFIRSSCSIVFRAAYSGSGSLFTAATISATFRS